MSEVVGRSVVVRGRVQGVGFRYSCRAVALDRGVAGWVRNAADGTVHAHLEGTPDAVDAVLEWMRRGPRGADVEGVEVHDVAPEGRAGLELG